MPKKNSKGHIFKRSYLVILITCIILTCLYLFLRATDQLDQPSEQIKALQEIETREYQGQDLSSIAAFRENSIKGSQYIDIADYRLTLEGLVQDELDLSYDQVLDNQRYQKVVTLHCVEGWSATILWEGILLRDLIDQAGPGAEANTVIFYAADGYSSSLPLDYILTNDILLAYKMNGVDLPPERGFPFQLVAENKWGYKWVKWITRIELSADTEFRGYWESAGYNQDGDKDGPKFDR